MIRIKDSTFKKIIHKIGLNNNIPDVGVEQMIAETFRFASKAFKEEKSIRLTNWGIYTPKVKRKKKK